MSPTSRCSPLWLLLELLALLPACLALIAHPTTALHIPDDEYALLPRLFHLDDYERCLAKPRALYCTGTLRLQPLQRATRTFRLMQEYSREPTNYDRLELHRGYCVSSRCPLHDLPAERNTSLRFERCVQQWARPRRLHVTHSTPATCTTHSKHRAALAPLRPAHWLLLAFITGLLLANVAGTVYDVTRAGPRHAALAAWSVRNNWRRLTAPSDPAHPLAPLHGARVLLMLLVIMGHTFSIYVGSFLYEPRLLEQMFRHPATMLIRNGTSVVQIFVMLSSFLTAHNMLSGNSKPTSFSSLPSLFLKRLARIAPLYYLTVWFGATWWERSGDGAQWARVADEAAVCRDKMWAHLLFLNNLVLPQHKCMLQSWYLAVDLQLYVVAAVLTVALLPLRRRALPLLTMMLLGSCFVNALLAYVFRWEALVYYMVPKVVRHLYREVATYSHFYQAPWGNVSACLLGLAAAHAHRDLHAAGYKLTAHKWLQVPFDAAVPAMFAFALAGVRLVRHTDPWFLAAFASIERIILPSLAALILLGALNGFNGWTRSALAWRGWAVPARLSLAVLLVHYLLDMARVAARPHLFHASPYALFGEFMVTATLSFVGAVPLTLLVEMPLQRLYDALARPAASATAATPTHSKDR